MVDLAKVLAEWDDWLEEAAPGELEALNEPASADAIARLNEAYCGRVPGDVVTLFAWHNGGEIPDPWWELSDIDDVIRIKELHASMPDLHERANWWSDNWIPIGADFDGNHLCVDLDGCLGGVPGQVLVYMHDDSERTIVAPSLGAYLEALLRACRDEVLVYHEEEGFRLTTTRMPGTAFCQLMWSAIRGRKGRMSRRYGSWSPVRRWIGEIY